MILLLPVYIQTVLLLFGDRIIYDSLLTTYNASFGLGIRRRLKETYRNVMEREGILTSFLSAVPVSQNAVRSQIECATRSSCKPFANISLRRV